MALIILLFSTLLLMPSFFQIRDKQIAYRAVEPYDEKIATKRGRTERIYKGRRYTDNGDGTVTDNITSLVWQKCSIGQSGNDCSGDRAALRSWNDANNDCASAYGSAWRLPTKKELISILNFSIPSRVRQLTLNIFLTLKQANTGRLPCP